jgi:hypothetical protein
MELAALLELLYSAKERSRTVRATVHRVTYQARELDMLRARGLYRDPVGCANSVAPAKRSNLTAGPYARSVGPRLAIASESPPIDKDRETWPRKGCGLAQSGPLKLVSW